MSLNWSRIKSSILIPLSAIILFCIGPGSAMADHGYLGRFHSVQKNLHQIAPHHYYNRSSNYRQLTKMKIALIGLTYPFRGGISHYTTLLYRALAEHHQIQFYSLSRQYPKLLFPGATQLDHSEMTIRVPNISSLDSINPISWFNTYRLIRRYDPDFLLFSWWHPFFAPAFGTVAKLASCLARLPSCFLCHNVFPHEPSWLDRMLLGYGLNAAVGFITHSAADREKLLQLYPRAFVLTNPHPNYDFFSSNHAVTREEARQRLQVQGKKVILFFGYVREYKGLAMLLAAMLDLPSDQGYHLIVAGEFYESRTVYHDAIQRLQEQQAITIIDRYIPNEEVGLYFTAADVVAAPYVSATQSGIIQIAYSFIKPVIATRVGGLPEAVHDGHTGILVAPADHALFAAAIGDFFTNEDTINFGENIRRENEKYSWKRMADTITRMGRHLADV